MVNITDRYRPVSIEDTYVNGGGLPFAGIRLRGALAVQPMFSQGMVYANRPFSGSGI
jgi:hypothetical protein